MNAAPHTHEAKVQRFYGPYDERWAGKWVVKYGDQKVTIANKYAAPNTPKFNAKVKRATAKAIAWHDAASVKAGIAANDRASSERVAREVRGSWTSER